MLGYVYFDISKWQRRIEQVSIHLVCVCELGFSESIIILILGYLLGCFILFFHIWVNIKNMLIYVKCFCCCVQMTSLIKQSLYGFESLTGSNLLDYLRLQLSRESEV